MFLRTLVALVVVVITIVPLWESSSEGVGELPLEPSLLKDLNGTYGYYQGQRFVIQSIQQRFPDLQERSKLAQMEFDVVFRSAFENIEKSLKTFYANQWLEYSSGVQKHISENLGSSGIGCLKVASGVRFSCPGFGPR